MAELFRLVKYDNLSRNMVSLLAFHVEINHPPFIKAACLESPDSPPIGHHGESILNVYRLDVPD